MCIRDSYEIDRWAKLFKAKTWEELRMIAKNNPDLLQASNDLYTVNADEIIRQQARARADAEFWERNKNAKIKQLEDTIIEQDNTCLLYTSPRSAPLRSRNSKTSTDSPDS